MVRKLKLDNRHCCWCVDYAPVGGHYSDTAGDNGAAIISCTESSNGEMWVGDGELASRVNYCPYCGMQATNQMVFSQ